MPRKDNAQEDYEEIKQEVVKEKVADKVEPQIKVVTQEEMNDHRWNQVEAMLHTVLQNQQMIFNALTGQQ